MVTIEYSAVLILKCGALNRSEHVLHLHYQPPSEATMKDWAAFGISENGTDKLIYFTKKEEEWKRRQENLQRDIQIRLRTR